MLAIKGADLDNADLVYVSRFLGNTPSPWKEYQSMVERLEFVAQLLDEENTNSSNADRLPLSYRNKYFKEVTLHLNRTI